MGRGTVYNSIISDELCEQINNDNKRLLKDFLMYKKSSDKSEGTIYQYEQIIRIFFVWNLENNDNKFFVDIKKKDFIRFFSYVVVELKSSPNRTRMIRAVLSSLSNYIEDILDEDYPNYRNIVKKIETATKVPVREKTVLTEEEVETCLSKLLEDEKYQIACYMALAACSGARKSEILRFKVSYFDEANVIFGCLYQTPEKIMTKGRGSRGKMLVKYTLKNEFQVYLDAWLKERKEKGINSDWLFVRQEQGTGKYQKAEVHNADYMASVIEKYLTKPFYAHCLRHYYTSHLSRLGLPSEVIVELNGWSSADMYNIYNDNSVMDKFAEYFNEDGIVTKEKKGLSDL